jgi:flagellar basal-body rod protein FlgC
VNLFQTLSISASGMGAQRHRAQLLAENLANAETTRTPEGGPYRRRDVVFQSDAASSPFSAAFQNEMGRDGEGVGAEGVGVKVSEVIEDEREPDRRYSPGHPDADKFGYVAYPRINPAEDMVDMMGASRNYGANVSAMMALKDMIGRSIDLLRS